MTYMRLGGIARLRYQIHRMRGARVSAVGETWAFVSREFREFMRDEVKAHYTTIAPYSPRSNGAIERQWRSLGA